MRHGCPALEHFELFLGKLKLELCAALGGDGPSDGVLQLFGLRRLGIEARLECRDLALGLKQSLTGPFETALEPFRFVALLR